ncbi:MAG: hypothetical protein JSV86_06795, partial [Gemmatimonadota bacterium]
MSAQSSPKSPSQLVAEVLLRNRVLTREQLQRAVVEARSSGHGLTHTLVSLGLVPEAVLLRLLSQIYRVKAIDLSKIQRIDPSALAKVTAEAATRALVLPLHRNGDMLIVAMVNPANRTAIAQLGRATGLTIQPVIATEFALRNAIQKHYGTTPPSAAAGAGAAAASPATRPQPPPTPQPQA